MENVEQTIISQYANSPTLVQLIHNMNEYIDPAANFEAFYNFVWNVNTAQRFGLDVWGKIVGVSRLLQIPNDAAYIGFKNSSIPQDWKTFGHGALYSGATPSQAYILPDSTYRVLVLAKALANIVATTTPALNQLLRNLFPGRGRCYVVDLRGMAMQFVFEFALTPAEYAILATSGVMPHPAGVGYSIVVIPTDEYFGFAEALPGVLPFDFGVFYP